MSSASVRLPETQQAESLTDLFQTRAAESPTSPESTSTVLWIRCSRMWD
jgi:hypothetical protein